MKHSMSGAYSRCSSNCSCDNDEAHFLGDDDTMVGVVATNHEVEIEVLFDTGAVGNVLSPEDVPGNATMTPNATGRNFTGAGGETIINHGTIDTLCTGEKGQVGCQWKVADITRPLHGGTQVTGPIDNPRQDVLMNARGVYVVEPGVVDEMLKKLKPVLEYKRKGNLYTAKMKMTGFTRQGQKA
jgi:hypothetical protein